MRGRIAIGGLALALFTVASHAAAVRTWSISSQTEFAAGELDGTAIDEEGAVRLGWTQQTLWGPGEGIVWAVEPSASGGVFVALSAPGRVIHVGSRGEEEVWFRAAEEGLVAALAADGSGGVYFGVSPEGRVYHSRKAELAEPLAETGAKFVWSLVLDADGSLWAATGLPGKVLRRKAGSTELQEVFDGGEDPVRCLTPLPGGGVLAGTGARGRVVRIDAAGRPFVLLDADEAEIVDLEVGPDGVIYALAARGQKQVASTAQPARAGASADETVRVVATPPPGPPAPPGEFEEEGAVAVIEEPARAPRRFKTPPGAALYRLAPDGGSRRIWEAQGEVPFALVRTASDKLVVATGDAGRLHMLDDRGRSSLMLEIASDQASALSRTAEGRLLCGGTTDARVDVLGPGVHGSGSYLSPPLDAGTVADWGRLSWELEAPGSAEATLFVRSGNTAEPDLTWTDWIALRVQGSRGVETGLPATRWFQARVDMTPSGKGESPVLRRLELFYQPHNRAPLIENLVVQPAGIVWSRPAQQMSAAQGPLVADDPVVRATMAGLQPGSATRPTRRSYELGARTVSWQAQDPDGDTLTFGIEIRSDAEPQWIPLAAALDGDFFTWDTRGLPDGLYRVRLTTEDSRDNPSGAHLADQQISTAFRIDNTRPSVKQTALRRERGRYEVEFEARDEGGNIAAVEMVVDAGVWLPLDPLDGVADSPVERYQVVIEGGAEVEASPRTLRVRVTDGTGNLGGDAWALR